jgi:hypothetical protein
MADQTTGNNRGERRSGQQTRMKRADFTGNARQERHGEECDGQRDVLKREPLNKETAEGERRTFTSGW